MTQEKQNWNVVISVRERGYRAAVKALQEYGEVSHTDFFNVLLMKVDSVDVFLELLLARITSDPNLGSLLCHVIPAFTVAVFQSPEEFESKIEKALTPLAKSLAEKSFHVRMRRRGFKGRLSSQDEERHFDHYLIGLMADKGRSARIDFADPDVVIAIEMVGQWAGISWWTRDDLKRYPFLTLD